MIGGTDPNDGVALNQANIDIRAALQTLQRIGASDRADSILTDFENSTGYADLDADRDHSQDWLVGAAARRYISAMTGLARKLTAAADSTGTQDQDDAARCFGVKGLSGDVASLAISRRDAGDRVNSIIDPNTLGDLLATAVRNGDDVLSHAVLEAAVNNGFADVVTQFQEAYPALAERVQRLWAAAHRKVSTQDITTAWRVAALKPKQLASLQDFEIAAAAAGQTNVGRWSSAS